MAYDFEEQEKLDALKAWWAKYGTPILAVLALVLLGFAAWNGWNWYQRREATTAMVHYEALEKAAREGNVNQVRDASGTLLDKYGRTAYAPRAALLAAHAFLEAGDRKAATDQLQWVVDKSKDDALIPVARLRLAGIKLDDKQYDDALAQLKDAPAAFAGLYADRRGDILVAQGKTDDARAAYKSALATLDPGSALRPVVQLKLDALGGV